MDFTIELLEVESQRESYVFEAIIKFFPTNETKVSMKGIATK